MPRYDVQVVKSAASGRWPEIISALATVDSRILDGAHHPCPKCGGDDRFNLSREGTGGAFCNHCQPGTSDGFATIEWLAGRDFSWSIEAVAKHLGIKPKKIKGKPSPTDSLEFLPWNPTIVGLWCLKKKPIKPEAVKVVGGQVAKYRDQYTVIAIPVWGPSLREADPVGWVLYRADGGMLPRGPKDRIDWVKVLLAPGSEQGVICAEWPAEPNKLIWKTEGPTDLLGLMSFVPCDDPAFAFTTGSGTGEKPLEWIIKLCEGHRVMVVHDADEPGQQGATWWLQRDGKTRPGWCPSLAESAARVVNVKLPFPIEKTHGPDLRDFLNGGATYSDLVSLIGTAEEFNRTGKKITTIEESIDDPHRLARVNLERYKTEHDGRLIYWRDEWLKWKSGRYKRIETKELRAKVCAAIRGEFEASYQESRAAGKAKEIKKVTRTLVSDVIGAMESICAISSSVGMPCWLPDRSKPHYVSAKNGILDLNAVFQNQSYEKCLLPHSSEWFSSFRLDYKFDPGVECPRWIEFLKYSLEDDQERIDLLQEWSGYLLTNSNYLQRFLVLEGEGGNGKTVYFAGMTAMLGEDNVSHVTLENFGGRFDLGTTIGKAANISGDIGEIDMVAEGTLKQFTGGDMMQFDRKNQTPIQVMPTAKLMASWNIRPKFRDKSMGIWRRMLLVPFNREIPPEHKILGMDRPGWWIESGEAPGILNWAIVGLHRLRAKDEFTRPKISIDAIEEYKRSTNPVLDFFDDYLEESEGSSIESMHLYDLYSHWARKSGRNLLGDRQFGREVKRKFKSVERKKFRNGKFLKWKYENLAFSVDEIFGNEVEKGNLF